MRKRLTLGLTALLMASYLAGCSKESVKQEEAKVAEEVSKAVQDAANAGGEVLDTIEDTAEKAGIKISLIWTDVKKEFEDIEGTVEKDAAAVRNYTEEQVSKDIDTLKIDYEKIKNGITENEHKVAKELYEASHRIEIWGKTEKTAASHELTKLAANTKAFVKHLYGKAEGEYSVLKNDIETTLGKSEEEFTKLKDKFLALFKN